MLRIWDLDMHPDDRALRQFGATLAVVSVLLSIWVWLTNTLLGHSLGDASRPIAEGLIGVAVLSFLFAVFWPRGNGPLYVVLATATYPIGLVAALALMALLFFCVFGVMAVVLRIGRRDCLGLRFDEAQTSYWRAREDAPRIDRYFLQF